MSDSDTEVKIEELWSAILANRRFPIDMRIFLIGDRQYIRVLDGHVERTQAISWTEHLRAERGAILDLFAKFEFLVNEIILFRIAGTDRRRLESLEVLEVVDFGYRIRLLREWQIITDKDVFTNLNLLLRVRNGLAHRWRIEEVKYRNVPVKAY